MRIANIEICVVILLVLVILCILKIHFKKLENFASPNKNEIMSEIDKQLYILNHSEKKKAYHQTSSYIPHLDIIKNYEGTSKNFLKTLENTVNKKIDSQKNELSKIDNYVRSLARYKDDDFLKQLKNTDFKTIKSHNNGQNLNINRLGYEKYQVMMNGGCLRVTTENDYNIVPCDLNDKNQEFRLEHIFNEQEYRSNMDKAFPQLSDIGKVHYPMTMVKSSINDNCLKNYHGNITIEPCREYEGQRWASSRNVNKCAKLF